MITAKRHYEKFYQVFQQTILKCLKPKMVFTLTGGWDTRVIAGILATNNIVLPALSWGTKLENIIAGKVASLLGFKHYVWSNNPNLILPKMKQLRENGCKYFLTAALFDEVNGSWTGSKARTFEQFEWARKIGVQRRLDGLDSIHKQNLYPEWITPFSDFNVLDNLKSIPWQLRKGKQIQRWILRNKFPRLWRIPYYDSLLPNFLPYYLHGLSTILHTTLINN